MKKRFAALALFAAAALMTSICIADTAVPAIAAAAEPARITAQEAQTRIDKNKKIVVADVRTKAEYDEKHVKDAVRLTLADITAKTAADLIPSKDTEVLVYCRSGKRSAEAAKKLNELGYKNVTNMGGIIDWPYATVTSAAEPERINAKQTKTRLEVNKKAVLIDVRTKKEFDEKHIKNAILLTLKEINEKTAAAIIPNKDTEVVVYCRSGKRSEDAAKKLEDLGYKNVVNYFGGMMEWPYDTAK